MTIPTVFFFNMVSSFPFLFPFLAYEGVQYEKRVAEKDNQMRSYQSSSMIALEITSFSNLEGQREENGNVFKKIKTEN